MCTLLRGICIYLSPIIAGSCRCGVVGPWSSLALKAHQQAQQHLLLLLLLLSALLCAGTGSDERPHLLHNIQCLRPSVSQFNNLFGKLSPRCFHLGKENVGANNFDRWPQKLS